MSAKSPMPVLLFTAVVVLRLLPGLFSFFDPQDFVTFLNPLSRGDGLSAYILEGWSWEEDTCRMKGDRIGFIRPLTSLTYIPEHFLWGARPWLYRLTSILFHVAACMAVYVFCRRFGGGGPFPGLLAAAVPGTIHAVWLINGRGDVLAGLSGLVGVLIAVDIAVRDERRVGRILLPALCCLVSMASKEMGTVSVPACILAYFAWPGARRHRRSAWVLSCALLVVLALYFAFRYAVFGGLGGYGSFTPWRSMPGHGATLLMQVTGAGLLPWRPVRLLFLALLAAPVAAFGLSSREDFRKAALLLALTAVFGFQSLVGETCDHYLFAPSLMFALLMAISLGRLRYGGPAAALLAALWFSLGVGEAQRLHRLTIPMERAYAAAGEIMDLAGEGARGPVYICPEYGGGSEGYLSELKNIPLYMDHIAGGAVRFETGLGFADPETGGISLRTWNGRSRTWTDADPGPTGATLFFWNGATLRMVPFPELDM